MRRMCPLPLLHIVLLSGDPSAEKADVAHALPANDANIQIQILTPPDA